jgi:hypothetical protein
MPYSSRRLKSLTDGLRSAKISYQLSKRRDDATMVEVAVPGERWEIEFLEEGAVEVEIFCSDGKIHGDSVLARLLSTHLD